MTARTVALGLAGLIFISLTTAAHAGGPGQRAAAARAEKAQDGPSKAGPDFRSYEWTEINPDARWAPRAGLQVVHLRGAFLLMGGRTPLPPSDPIIPGASEIWGDVWKSEDRGVSWFEILETDDEDHWPARAYFEAVTKGGRIYVLGGQNFKVVPNECPVGVPGCPPFITASDFFNDVWSSRDGVTWNQLTAEADWEGRAGLSAAVLRGEIYVLGGSKFDDASIGGPAGPQRIYFNDVWKSTNGRDWVQVTAAAPWAPRAGAEVVVKNGYLWLLGGEEGFLCAPQPCDPPYFNDVWRSRDGENWELVTASAGWSTRPGHKCGVLLNHIVCLGGFGQSDDFMDPFKPSNPMDVWVSKNGEDWTQVSDSPWNATGPDEIKYDFALVSFRGGKGGSRPAVYTFGGDRETFNFFDPFNYLNVDNDVWSYAPPE